MAERSDEPSGMSGFDIGILPLVLIKNLFGELAQLVERLHGMQEVSGSTPLFSTKVAQIAAFFCMKRLFILLVFSFAIQTAFSQKFMQGVGLSVMLGTTKKDLAVAGGITYMPRYNFFENKKYILTVDMPLTLGLSDGTSTTLDLVNGIVTKNSPVFTVNVPLFVNINTGRGSNKENRKRFGYFLGLGYGYHHGAFYINLYQYGTSFPNSKTLDITGPVTNAGIRIGVGKRQRNIELRFSYMKGLNEMKPNIFGISGGYNF